MKKFKVAFNGIKEGIKHQAILIQVILGFMAVLGGIIIKLNYYEWIAFIICIGCVIGSEMLNTCIEKICDFIEPNYNVKIKVIKDISSGAVLIFSLMALIVCIFTVLKRL